MKDGKVEILILILERNKEVSIASTIYKLKIGIDKDLGIRSNIIIFDNGSNDDSATLASLAGAWVIKYPHQVSKSALIKKSLEVGVSRKCGITVLLDRMGGNTAEDAISVAKVALERKKDFVSGYVVPETGSNNIGCLAVNPDVLNMLYERRENAIDLFYNLQKTQNLDKFTIKEAINIHTKKKSKEKKEKESIWKQFIIFRRENPMKFYGFL
ncbi:MAG: hypothetical protein KAH57_11790, partial [Thermoplasmata archaeon]|nr:hypothetical protein [Thermoplasmata archaeon]